MNATIDKWAALIGLRFIWAVPYDIRFNAEKIASDLNKEKV